VTARSRHDPNLQSEVTKSSSHTHLRTTQRKCIEIKRKPVLCPPDVSAPDVSHTRSHHTHKRAPHKQNKKQLQDIIYVST
jgi:hypothetical protein